MNEEYLTHWVPNYTLIYTVSQRAYSDSPKVYLISSLENRVFLALSSVVEEALTTDLRVTLGPSFLGRLLCNPNTNTIAESDTPFTKQTHPELFI